MKRGVGTAVSLALLGVLVGAGGAVGFAALEGLREGDDGIWTLSILSLFAGGALIAVALVMLAGSVVGGVAGLLFRRGPRREDRPRGERRR